MRDHLVLRVVAKFIIPFLLMFGLYVQFHGEYSPGGGFQAGVIFAVAFVLYCLIFGLEHAKRVISIYTLRVLCSVGVLLYAGTGVLTMLLGGKFLQYSVLSDNSVHGHEYGIVAIELGVGITVFAVMLMIFYVFVERKEQ